MQEELSGTFAAACQPGDRLYVLPVFYAGGTASRKLTADQFVDDLRRRKIPAAFAPDYPTLLTQLVHAARPGDTILVMGARDPELPRFAREVYAALPG
jgi:UDP-N-acetylmuramate--alanine ligase